MHKSLVGVEVQSAHVIEKHSKFKEEMEPGHFLLTQSCAHSYNNYNYNYYNGLWEKRKAPNRLTLAVVQVRINELLNSPKPLSCLHHIMQQCKLFSISLLLR